MHDARHADSIVHDAAAGSDLGISILDADDSLQKDEQLLQCGCEAIDSTLGGGLSYLDITSIASVAPETKSLVALHFVASHLISRSHTNVVVLDTAGTFPVELLRDVIVEKLRRTAPDPSMLPHAGYIYQPAGTSSASVASVAEQQATAFLERVRIARVFDVTGLAEVTGEIRHLCDAPDVSQLTDSEANRTGPDDSESIGVLLVDDLPSLLNPLLRANHVEAQALLGSIIRSLRLVARRHGICVLLLNGTVGDSEASEREGPPGRPAESISIFDGVKVKPALGRTFAQLVDTNIMLSKLPKSRQDAEAAHGRVSAAPTADTAHIEVMEVLKNRRDLTRNRVAAFEILDGRSIASLEV